MSELIQQNRGIAKLQLLMSVSALALIANISSDTTAKAEDTEHSVVWIELGGQLERIDGGSQQYVPPFVSTISNAHFTPPTKIDHDPRYSNGAEGKVSFVPSGSDWIFSASLRFGRSNRARSVHEQTSPASAKAIQSIPALSRYSISYVTPRAQRFADTTSRREESHAVVDFQVGKDVGLGMFGSASTLSAGVRFAQFTAKSNVSIGANPDFAFSYVTRTQHRYFPPLYRVITFYSVDPTQHWHLYNASAISQRSFRGVGPSLSWNSSLKLTGNRERGELLFDWGANAAMLFGRQKAQVHHQTTGQYHSSHNFGSPTTVYRRIADHTRSRSAIIPNVGGFVGASIRYDNAKLSVGYRGDFFFGAMDGGIDTRKTEDEKFYGPFATVSIGLGG